MLHFCHVFWRCYQCRGVDPRRTLSDHPRLKVSAFTVEKFAAWKLSLKNRQYSVESINHYLGAVRAMFRFAEETDPIEKAPKLKRVRNQRREATGRKPLHTDAEVQRLLDTADDQLKAMVLLALNCGFGPKDIHDLTWNHMDGSKNAFADQAAHLLRRHA